MSEADDDALFTDSDGVPTLFDVVVPGDALRSADYRLPDQGGGDAAGGVLEEMLRAGIRRHFPGAFARAAREALERSGAE